jgi:hypothetical protein
MKLSHFLLNTYNFTALITVPIVTICVFDGFYTRKIAEKWNLQKTIVEFILMIGYCTFYSVGWPIFLPVDLYKTLRASN